MNIKIQWLIICSVTIVLVAAAVWFLSSLYGFPWKERSIANKLSIYLEEKYDQEFSLKDSFYSFKNGTYWGIFYPKEDSSLEFYAEEGFADYEYVDTYPEVLWARQLEKDVEPMYKEIYPDLESFHTNYVTYQSLDMVKGPNIPRYDESKAELSIIFKLDQIFSDLDNQWNSMAKLIHKVQSLTSTTDISLNFIEKEKHTEAFIICPSKSEVEIKTAQQAKDSCRVNRYDLETSTSVDE